MPLHIGHVIRHHLEITIFILNNPQLSERHVETGVDKIISKRDKARRDINYRFLKQTNKNKYHGPEIIHSFLFPS